MGPQRLHEAGRCVVGVGDDLRPGARFADGGDAIGDRHPRADEQHCLRTRCGDPVGDGAEVPLGPIEFLHEQGGFPHRREALLRTFDQIGAEAVVHMQHTNAVHADQAQVLHRALGLALIGGAHIEQPGVDRPVQHHRAGGRPHQRQPGLGQHRQDGLGVRRAAGQEQADHPWVVGQCLGVFGGDFGVELVVQRHQFNLLSIHPALGIDGVEMEFGAVRGLLDPGGHRAAETGGLSDAELRPGGRRPHQGCRQAQGAQGAAQACVVVHSSVSFVRTSLGRARQRVIVGMT